MIDISMKLKNEYPKLYEAALKEFAYTSFDNASLNRILNIAGMSKGSFYHHIKDKYTLYLMLIGCIAARKLEIFKEIKKNLSDNFFDKLYEITNATCKFIYSEPLLYKLTLQLTQESADFIENLYKGLSTNDMTIWIQMVNEGIETGQIRKDLPKEMIISFLNSSLKGLYSIVQKNLPFEEFKKAVAEYMILIKDALSS